jgi:uncharacterized YccA/Bax inhibitor family protein
MKAFLNPQILAGPAARTMTLHGTIAKTGILLGLCSITAVMAWNYMQQGTPSQTGNIALFGSVIGALVLGLVISFAPRTAPVLAPIYALLEGAVVGLISWVVPQHFHVNPGVVIQAIMLTFGITAALLIAYSLGLVRLGSTATKVILVATSGICIYYLAVMMLSLIGLPILSLGWSSGLAGIGFSLFVVVLASLNLVLDFQFIEAGAVGGAPKHMEWYGAFSLMVTLVWLYFEVLRLLSKLRDR